MMTLRLVKWRSGLARAVPLGVMLSILTVPTAAAERGPASGAGPIRTSIKRIATDRTLMPAPAGGTARRTQQTDSSRDASFFKSKPGVLALVIMAVGVGYALYSTKNDRITSPGKE